jgi:hypothetical protein
VRQPRLPAGRMNRQRKHGKSGGGGGQGLGLGSPSRSPSPLERRRRRRVSAGSLDDGIMLIDPEDLDLDLDNTPQNTIPRPASEPASMLAMTSARLAATCHPQPNLSAFATPGCVGGGGGGAAEGGSVATLAVPVLTHRLRSSGAQSSTDGGVGGGGGGGGGASRNATLEGEIIDRAAQPQSPRLLLAPGEKPSHVCPTQHPTQHPTYDPTYHPT